MNWWETLVTTIAGGLVGGAFTMIGVTITQRSVQQSAIDDRADRARERRAAAFADHLAAQQKFFTAVDRFLMGTADQAEVEAGWEQLSVSTHHTILVSTSRELADTADDLMRSIMPILGLVRRGERATFPYLNYLNVCNGVGARLGRLMRTDTAGQPYWPGPFPGQTGGSDPGEVIIER